MQLILGLGNPGAKYANSRHNVGFDAVEACAAFFQVRLRKRCFRLYRQAKVGSSVTLVEPLTYMNNSGEVMQYFPDVKAEEIVVVCDQMDLPPGLIRIRRGGSSAGHNGLKSLIDALGSSNFTRIYIGIGRPAEGYLWWIMSSLVIPLWHYRKASYLLPQHYRIWSMESPRRR